MIRYLVIGSTEKFNLFPAKHGVTNYYSPETLVTRRTFDYKPHCKYEFGKYVHIDTYNDLLNDMTEKTLDAIYLQPSESSNRHTFMDLTTGQEINRGGK